MNLAKYGIGGIFIGLVLLVMVLVYLYPDWVGIHRVSSSSSPLLVFESRGPSLGAVLGISFLVLAAGVFFFSLWLLVIRKNIIGLAIMIMSVPIVAILAVIVVKVPSFGDTIVLDAGNRLVKMERRHLFSSSLMQLHFDDIVGITYRYAEGGDPCGMGCVSRSKGCVQIQMSSESGLVKLSEGKPTVHSSIAISLAQLAGRPLQRVPGYC